MELNGGPANPAVTAQVSFSFQDELTATLHHALGVAVEIAVAQITGLLDRALRDVQDIKNNEHSITKTDQAHAGTVTSVFEVAVKVEKEETSYDPIPASLSVMEEPNSDSLFLAQSRMLEDWRPEPLQSERGQSNIHCQSTSHPGELDFLSSQSSSQQINLPNLHNNNQKNPERHMFPPGRRRYHCSICGRDFHRNYDLKIHQRIHTGELPYTCNICSAHFHHALTLKRHRHLSSCYSKWFF